MHARVFVIIALFHVVGYPNACLCSKFQSISSKNKKDIETLVAANQSEVHVHAREILLFSPCRHVYTTNISSHYEFQSISSKKRKVVAISMILVISRVARARSCKHVRAK